MISTKINRSQTAKEFNSNTVLKLLGNRSQCLTTHRVPKEKLFSMEQLGGRKLSKWVALVCNKQDEGIV